MYGITVTVSGLAVSERANVSGIIIIILSAIRGQGRLLDLRFARSINVRGPAMPGGSGTETWRARVYTWESEARPSREASHA